MNFPIDLVYLWCDGNDPEFQKRKNKYLKTNSNLSIDEQIDELKYSLRSVQMYIPWIRHIYIVTDKQIPTWLNLERGGVSIIDNSQILPKSCLPTFNSMAIETALHKIPNLAEHFLYANDDMFINQPLTPSFFFTEKGLPIVRLKPTHFTKIDIYHKTILKNFERIKKKFGLKYYPLCPHHNIDAYTKKDFNACIKAFREEYIQTQTHRFRSEDDIQRSLISLFALSKKQAQLKLIYRHWYDKLLAFFGFGKIDSLVINQSLNNHEKLKRIKKWHPALFCLNDASVSQEQRKRGKVFLEKVFPIKSEFEKNMNDQK